MFFVAGTWLLVESQPSMLGTVNSVQASCDKLSRRRKKKKKPKPRKKRVTSARCVRWAWGFPQGSQEDKICKLV